MTGAISTLHDYITLPQPQKEQLLQLQRDILESVAMSNNHTENLNKLCLAAEAMLPNAVASIMLYDENREHLIVRVAPSIPEEGIRQLNGLVPGPQAGSCGTAMFCKTPIFVENTATDSRWEFFDQFVADFNIHACWSMPIQTPDNLIIGSFALSSFESRAPNDFQKKLLSIGANLSGIILQREDMEKKLWNMAHLDSLTSLANRTLLNQRINHAITIASRQRHKIALLFIDLDNFKHINDSYGHTLGDETLITTANTIKKHIRKQDTLSRIGGDEFVLLLETITDSADSSKVAQAILSSLNNTSPIAGSANTISASIGISIYPDDALSSEALLRNADTAMYEAKNKGRNGFSFYESAFTKTIREQLTLESELKSALINDEFEVFYQPQFSCDNSQLVAAEALIRWHHPKRGFLAPDSFIPTAEKSNLINQMGLWVLQKTCFQGKKWLNDGLKFDRLSVNLSMRQLVTGFHHEVLNILSETGFPLDKLELEITESLLMSKGDIAISELKTLQALGISIAMDDFGMGYSSLNQIQKLPLDKLKIDRSFIDELPENKNDAALAKMILAMGKALSLKVIAEGVETEQQQAFLVDEGCDLLQGFLLGKPMPATEIERLMFHV